MSKNFLFEIGSNPVAVTVLNLLIGFRFDTKVIQHFLKSELQETEEDLHGGCFPENLTE